MATQCETTIYMDLIEYLCDKFAKPIYKQDQLTQALLFVIEAFERDITRFIPSYVKKCYGIEGEKRISQLIQSNPAGAVEGLRAIMRYLIKFENLNYNNTDLEELQLIFE